MRMRRMLTGGTALVLASTLALAGCGDDGDDSSSGDKGSLVVVSAGFTESDLFAQMYAQLLEDEGYDVKVQTVDNRELYMPSLADGSADVAPDYLGSLTNYLYSSAQDDPEATVATSDVDATLAELRTLAEAKGLDVLEPAESQNANAYAVRKEFAEENSLTTLSDLGAADVSVRVAGPEECKTRPLCGVLLEKDYGIDVSKYAPFAFDSPVAKKQVQDDKADIAVVSTLAPDLEDFGLVVLEDDKGLTPAENHIPLIGADSPLASDDDAKEAFEKLSAALESAEVGALLIRIDSDREKAEDVAREYLESKDLI
jgi:osmoprotectant transport system substrate-binding protein